MDNIIEVKNLNYTYEGYGDMPPVKALKDVSFNIERGSFTVILGHNGSGKSTLASVMCMLSEADSGEVIIDGRCVTDESMTDEDIMDMRRRVGMVFQNPDNQLVATIVEEDVAFGCENLGMPSDEIRRRVDAALETVGMTKYARHAAHKLSGGQKQRVAIAGVIAMKREIIIFDESTAMLDPMGRREVLDTIERLNKEDGITVVLITHHMEEAARADHIIVMNGGEVLCTGTPNEVFGDPERMWAAGLDVPQSTELLYKLKKAGFDVRIDIFDPYECAREIDHAMRRMRLGGETGGKS